MTAPGRLSLLVSLAGVLLLGGCRTQLLDPPPEAPQVPDLATREDCQLWLLDRTGLVQWVDVLRFELHTIGALQCKPRFGTPLSLAVESDGHTGWVFYSDLELFRVELETGACTSTPFDAALLPQDRTGALMGTAVASAPSSASPMLYVTTPEVDFRPRDFAGTRLVSVFGAIDLGTLRYAPIANLETVPSLTPDGQGGLLAVDINGAQSIDKQSGALGTKMEIKPFYGGFAADVVGVATPRSIWLLINTSFNAVQLDQTDRATGHGVTGFGVANRRIAGSGIRHCGG